MSELDKYFEKARNVEPIYEKDDAKKLLYGKLSDGGIATNLYNKIKAYPMIATLITSVATIATIALLSISSPNTKVAQTSIKNTTEIIDNKAERPTEKQEDLDWTEEKQPTNQSSVALLSEEKEELNKKPKALNWTEEKIDIKSVNTLKLTKDELAKLGIEIDSKSFKVNAFDKYTYTINQKNEKQRDYYNQDEDRDALPTPAMVTTSTGFKTLTLFKKGNVEATVDRYRSESEDGYLKHTTNIEQNIKTNDADIEIKVNKIESNEKELNSNSDLNYVVDGDTVSVKYTKSTDSTERSLSIKFPKGYEDIKDLDSHKEKLDGLVNSLDDKQIATAFKKKDPKKRNDTLVAKIDLGSVNSDFFEKSFDVVEELTKALSDSPDLPYILNHIDKIKSINLNYQYNRLASDYQQIIDKESKLFDFTKYNLRNVFDKELDSTKFDDPKYLKTFQVSWWGYPDFFDEKNSRSKDCNNDGIIVQEGTVTQYDELLQNELNKKPYSRDLLLRENDNMNVVMLKSYKTTEDGSDVNVLSDRNIEVYTTDMNRKDVDAVIKATLDSLASKNTTLIEVEATKETSSNDPNNRTIYMPLESLEEGKKLIINKIETNAEFEIEDGKSDLEFKLKPGQTVWADENQDGTNKAFVSNMSFDFINYNINELIPIEISFDGVNTDFIVWYEATEEFLTKLPSNLLEKINPELAAISDQAQHCDNAPIEKDNAVMDVWSGCSGAIKEMKVYPNPATSNSNVEFELQDNRVISIAVYDLSGKLIKSVKSGMALDKGSNSRSLNLNGVNPGLYYVVVKSDRGEQALQRIIIE